MSRKLESMGVTDCGDLQKISLQVLQKEFGPKTGQALYKSCRGQDDRPIKVERERKSVSAEINYGIRFTKVSDLAWVIGAPILNHEICHLKLSIALDKSIYDRFYQNVAYMYTKLFLVTALLS